MTSRADSQPLSYLTPGTIVAARYEITEVLGRGGMGLVVKAKDLNLDGEIIALKVLYPMFARNANTIARFRREVLLTRRLSHPNIIRIFDLGTAKHESGESLHYISMEYVEGKSLEARLKDSPKGLPVKELAPILSQVAAGLGFAHKHGVIHRDMKPGNILVTDSGEAKITDLGVARSIDSSEKLTRTNEAIGSPSYMSPEQITAETIDHRADIYSLGILAYELAQGEVPFDGQEWMEIVSKQISEPLPRITQPDVPEWYQSLCQKACAKDLTQRFQSCAEFAAALGHSPAKSSFVMRRPRMPQTYAVPAAVALVTVLIVSIGYVVIDHLIKTISSQ